MSVPLHCTCGVFMGYFYGMARGQEARGSAAEAARARRLALLVPWVIHGLYDYSLDIESLLMLIWALIFTLLVFCARRAPGALGLGIRRPHHGAVNLSGPCPAPLKGKAARRGNGTPPPPFNM